MHDDSSTLKLMRTAHHEAGHATMRIVLNLPFTKVIIEESKGIFKSSGALELPEGAGLKEEDVLVGKLCLKEALCAIAGPVAESILIGQTDRKSWNGGVCDIGMIHICCHAAVQPSGIKLEEFNFKRSLLVRTITESLSMQAYAILKEHWSGVRAIASHLIKHRSLTADEAKSIFAIETAGDNDKRSGLCDR